MPLFNKALYGQLAWFAMATIYNCLSLFSLTHSQTGYAGDQATTLSAMGAVIAFTTVTLIGLKGWLLAYRFLAPTVTVLLLLGGVLKHVIAGPTDYASQLAWVLAIAINLVGFAAFALGSWTALRDAPLAAVDQ
ncbi:hypothetical protein [Erythrobacter sp. Alg231-14]|uniref:hypothetical protein n=1 Tax=Erythrobacter sp. Alg231-14 TaxID=1922225 RepID=UPI000D55BE46